jgi:hypothetical protein
MRKSALIFAAGAIFASFIFLMILDADPKSEPQPDASFTPSSGANQTRQMDVQPAADSPGAQSSESQKAQLVREDERGEVVTSIPIPHEFDLVSADKPYWHRDSWRRLHGRLEREPFDPTWSRSAEEAVMRAITSNQEIVRRGTPIVNCRTTICEMQMVVYGNDSDDGKWHTYFNPVLKTLDADFKFEDLSTAQEGSVMTIVFILSKKE